MSRNSSVPITTIDKKQARINRRRKEILIRYPALWDAVIAEWNSPGPEDRAWLPYSANYLFRTAGIRWALDPLTLHWRVPEAPEVDAARDLCALSFVLLTHAHGDHLDLGLVRTLSTLPTRWVIPAPLLTLVESAGLSPSKIVTARPMESFELEGIRITPFNGLHWDTDSSHPDVRRGVPATGYLVEFSGKRWLFPGDTRTYTACQLPSFGKLDGLFAHLWLGRGCALQKKPPLQEAFCSFCLDLQPRRIVVTHLEEFGRAAEEYWDNAHFLQVRKGILKRAPEVIVECARLGEGVDL